MAKTELPHRETVCGAMPEIGVQVDAVDEGWVRVCEAMNEIGVQVDERVLQMALLAHGPPTPPPPPPPVPPPSGNPLALAPAHAPTP